MDFHLRNGILLSLAKVRPFQLTDLRITFDWNFSIAMNSASIRRDKNLQSLRLVKPLALALGSGSSPHLEVRYS